MPDRMRGVKSDSPEQESADDALKRIVDGFQHFRREVFPEQQALFKKLANSQRPRAMFITCADSRIVPELITQSSPATCLVTRNVGNVVPPYGQMNGGVSTAIEYAVLALGVHHIIVCGHSDCGAMRAVLDPQTLERMPTVKAWLRHAEVARTVVADNCDCGASHDTLGCSPKRTWWPSSITCAPTLGGLAPGQRATVHPRLGVRHRECADPRLRRQAGSLPAPRRRASGADGHARAALPELVIAAAVRAAG